MYHFILMQQHEQQQGHKNLRSRSKLLVLLGSEKMEDENQQQPPLLKKKLKIKFSKTSHLTPGSTVEVTSDDHGYQGSWYVAKILTTNHHPNHNLNHHVAGAGAGAGAGADADNSNSSNSNDNDNHQVVVEYQHLFSDHDSTLLHTELTSVHNVRPSPPHVPVPATFTPNQQVDAWFNDGWWSGSISRLLPHSIYVVYFSFTNEHLEFHHSKLRPHQDWVDGTWLLPHNPNPNTPNNPDNPTLSKGARVEVKSDAEGFEGSFFAATILDLIGTDKFLVEYETLRSDDDTELLKEEADASFVRPYPPHVERGAAEPYNRFDKVDAWYNDGWWEGTVSKVHANMKYAVYFASSNEVLQLDHSNLRPHQEWIDGKWLLDTSH